jgi:hypothetical protein
MCGRGRLSPDVSEIKLGSAFARSADTEFSARLERAWESVGRPLHDVALGDACAQRQPSSTPPGNPDPPWWVTDRFSKQYDPSSLSSLGKCPQERRQRCRVPTTPVAPVPIYLPDRPPHQQLPLSPVNAQLPGS